MVEWFEMVVSRVEMMAELTNLGFRLVDYWAWHLQMETQRGLQMVDQMY